MKLNTILPLQWFDGILYMTDHLGGERQSLGGGETLKFRVEMYSSELNTLIPFPGITVSQMIFTD